MTLPPAYCYAVLQGVLDAIRSVPPLLAYAIIALLVFGEAAFFVGFVVPGETAVLLGGFLASQGNLDIVTLIVVVVISAILGDTVGYEVGKHLGPRVLRLGIFEKHQSRLDAARDMLRRRGGPAVFLGRWTAFLRAVMPGLAGISRMSYPRFFFFNATGGLLWGVAVALLGYFAGNSYGAVENTLGRTSAVVLAVLVLAVLVVWHRARRRKAREADEADEEPAAPVEGS